MSNDARDDLMRLQRALDALATDLDAIERRPHLFLRNAVEVGEPHCNIEGFVGKLALAVEKARLGV